MLAELSISGLPPETVAADFEDGKLKLKGKISFFEIGNQDIAVVSYPKKDVAIVRFGISGQHSVRLQQANIEGYLKHFLGQFQEQFSPGQRLLRSSFGMLFLVLSGIAAIAALVWLFMLPWVAGKAADNFPRDYEITLGNQLKQEFLAAESVDTSKSRMLTGFADKIDFESVYPLTFTVVNSSTVNAFALPGGHVVVYSGILERMKTADELAALLSHEVSHIEKRHSTRSLFRSLSGTLLLTLIFGDAGVIAGAVAQQAEQLRSLSYSRDLESEADREGLLILRKNAIDQKGMQDLLRNISLNNGVNIPEILSSHPVPESRLKDVTELIQENQSAVKVNAELIELWGALKE